MELKYSAFKENIDSFLMSRIIKEIFNSEEIELLDELKSGQLSHIVIKGTQTPIGYLGDDHLEFVNYGNKNLKKYHQAFEEIYKKAILTCPTLLN